MQLPHPLSTHLAGCVWLERHVTKTRVFLRGELPWSYRIAFGSGAGLDGYFFRHFGLRKSQILAIVRENPADAEVAAWFLSQPNVTTARINEWNQLSPRFGSRANPGYVTRKIVTFILYPRLIGRPVTSLMHAICLDEGLPPLP